MAAPEAAAAAPDADGGPMAPRSCAPTPQQQPYTQIAQHPGGGDNGQNAENGLGHGAHGPLDEPGVGHACDHDKRHDAAMTGRRNTVSNAPLS